MKKFILFLFVGIFMITGCQNTSKTVNLNQTTSKAVDLKLDSSDVSKIYITVLPSPPKIKTVTKKEDIVKIVNLINSIKLEKIQQDRAKGWQYLIKINGKEEHEITFVRDKIHFDKQWFKIDVKDTEKLGELYKRLNYKEEPYINK